MQNFVQPGKVLALTAPYGLTSGQGVLVGTIFGVASGDALINAEVEAECEGVFDLTKGAGISLSQGDKVYWNNSTRVVTDDDTQTPIGSATQAAAGGDATARVWVNRGNTTNSTSDGAGRSVDVTLTSLQILSLNATPISVIPTPGSGLGIVLISAVASKPSGTAYGGIASGEDLVLRYTDGSGAIGLTIETTGFLDQSTAQNRYVQAASVTPVANAAIMAHMAVGEITTGDTTLLLRISYRIVPIPLV